VPLQIAAGQHTRTHTQTRTQTRRICRQVLIALRFLHARDIGHHGLSPSHILFTPGYASAGLPGDLSASNARWYRAPEQLVGAPVGCEADVWALGCILFEMAAGEPLLPGNSDAEQLTLVERAVGGTLPDRFELGRRAVSAVSAAAFASAGSSSRAEAAGAVGGGGIPFANPPTHMSAPEKQCVRGMHPDIAAVVSACLEVNPLKRPGARYLLSMPLFQIKVRFLNGFQVGGGFRGRG
jgi:serine/threonine protein kinase